MRPLKDCGFLDSLAPALDLPSYIIPYLCLAANIANLPQHFVIRCCVRIPDASFHLEITG